MSVCFECMIRNDSYHVDNIKAVEAELNTCESSDKMERQNVIANEMT